MVKRSAASVEDYISQLPGDNQQAIRKVRDLILENLPPGYEETVNWGMICYEIPLAIYPKTYNGKPLMYAALAAQKHFNSLYLMNVYQDPGLLELLLASFSEKGMKCDMGKSCLHFKTYADLPSQTIAEIIASTPADDYIARYEHSRKTSKQ